MTRLIDADTLKYEPLPKGDRNYRTYNLDDAYEDGYDDAFENVMNAPTIEAEPVRHGKWREYPIADGMNQCSECGVLRFGKSNYCPYCGADMRGAKNERTD